MSRTLRSPGGRQLVVAGNSALITLDRLDVIGRRFDSDPRIASVSVIGNHLVEQGWVRATAPAGVAIVMAIDAEVLTGPILDGSSPAVVQEWAARASDRGFWHDWFVTNANDIVRAATLLDAAETDIHEGMSPSSAAFMMSDANASRRGLTVNVDATWLGEHQTGAQVLTVAAVSALAEQDEISSITLTGISALPPYAQHLAALPKVHLAGTEGVERADIVWFPNQIDGRSNIAEARELGRRVVTTYLDLIAYDIPRYHASRESWESYRNMQRSIALRVDGVATISADVATRILSESPRLESSRVRAIPLGLDHVRPEHVPVEPPAEVGHLADRRFILVLGNDFAHKNRDLAIAAWQQLLQRGIACDLVLAGLHVKSSSSKSAEDRLLSTHVDLRGKAHSLGHVDSATRAWLLANAIAVHYPTSAEGFGFVPYEAATLGTPSAFTDFGPLHEISLATNLPRDWAVTSHAKDLEQLITDQQFADTRISELQAAIANHSWQVFAEQLTAFFVEVSSQEPSVASALTSTSSDSARLAQILQSRSWRVAEKVRKLKPRRG